MCMNVQEFLLTIPNDLSRIEKIRLYQEYKYKQSEEFILNYHVKNLEKKEKITSVTISKPKFINYYILNKIVNDCNIDDFIFIAVDKNTNDAKKFFHKIPVTEINKLLHFISSNNHCYETIPENCCVKPYFDLEMEYEYLTTEIQKEKLNIFIEWLICKIKAIFAIELTINDLQIINSSTLNKLSYHLIIQNKMYFKNNADQKNGLYF